MTGAGCVYMEELRLVVVEHVPGVAQTVREKVAPADKALCSQSEKFNIN